MRHLIRTTVRTVNPGDVQAHGQNQPTASQKCEKSVIRGVEKRIILSKLLLNSIFFWLCFSSKLELQALLFHLRYFLKLTELKLKYGIWETWALMMAEQVS